MNKFKEILCFSFVLLFSLTGCTSPTNSSPGDSDDVLVRQAKSDLNISFAPGDSAGNATSNITLPLTVGSVGISWSTNDPGVISNTGTVIRPSSVQGNATVVLTATLSKGSVTDTKQFTLTVKAYTAPISYSITYDPNGGTDSLVDPNSPYSAGSTVTVLANSFTRNGYTFSGWNTISNGSGTGYNGGDTFSINSDITLYAQWTQAPSNEFYAITQTGFIWKASGTSAFSMYNNSYAIPTTDVMDITKIGSDLYAITISGYVWKSTGGTTAFSMHNNTSPIPTYNVVGVTAIGSDLYAITQNGYIWKSVGGTAAFTIFNNTYTIPTTNVVGVTAVGSDLYAITQNGYIWKSTGGTSAFTIYNNSYAIPTNNVEGITVCRRAD